MSDYRSFLARKRRAAPDVGFTVTQESWDHLKPFQAALVRWACRLGKAAVFADTGLGKSRVALTWADLVQRHTNKPVLILTPLAVGPQFVEEAARCGIEGVKVAKNQAEAYGRVNVTNYQRLHLFSPEKFAGVVCDESGILKNFMGKTRLLIEDAFKDTRYKLCCTATPSPNDNMEIGQHANFLDVMPSNEMLMRWFINDPMNVGKYRLKNHGTADFWRWVSSWATAMGKPSDLDPQYDDAGYILPPLEIEEHVVSAEIAPEPGFLFDARSLSATNIHREMKQSTDVRADQVAEIVSRSPGPWVVWCNTDYEADALKRVLPKGTADVRGSDKIEKKESVLSAFGRGELPILITKPTIAGFGLNWQHCHDMAFVGLSYSYEQFYQAIRRSWRFGQRHAVTAHIVLAEGEAEVRRAILRKEADHAAMKAAMVQATREHGIGLAGRKALIDYAPAQPIYLPPWIQSPVMESSHVD